MTRSAEANNSAPRNVSSPGSPGPAPTRKTTDESMGFCEAKFVLSVWESSVNRCHFGTDETIVAQTAIFMTRKTDEGTKLGGAMVASLTMPTLKLHQPESE